MEFPDLIQKRYSVRKYRPDPIPDAILNRVLEAAQAAPSAANRQPVQFIVIPTRGREADLERIYPRLWFREGPLVICACAVPAEAWTRRDGRNYAWVDATIAMDHLVLAATHEGLGTCWVAAFDPDAAREVPGLPEGTESVAFTPLGYPADRPGGKSRKPINELVRHDHW